MNSTKPVFQAFRIVIGFSLVMLFAEVFLWANEWKMEINAIDFRLGYIGGERYVFLNIMDQDENHLTSLSSDNISLKINQEPVLLSNFGHYQHLENRIALLVDGQGMVTTEKIEMIKKGFGQFIRQKQELDEILINFNGLAQKGKALTSKEQLSEILATITPNQEKEQPTLEFLFQQLQLFRFQEKRQWAILLSSVSPSYNEKDFSNLVQFLKKHQITLMAILNRQAVSSWWETLVAQTNGSIYPFNTVEELPEVLEKVRQRIDQEYMLTYQLNTLGNIPHDIEIKLVSNEGQESIQSQVSSIPIWPHSQKPFLLWGWVCIGVGLVMGGGGIFIKRWNSLDSKKKRGFRIITPGENFQFIPLNDDSYVLEFLSSIQTKGNLRLSANLSKVVLTAKQNSYFLDDKNYKNALLINRRRVRRTLLRHGDILDIGELTLIYLNSHHPLPMHTEIPKHTSVPIHYDKPQGPIRKSIGLLIDEDRRQDYYLVKNITFIGRSKTNNIILDSPQIALRHAKIVRIGAQYKLHSLSNQKGSFVNRRRVEQRFLKDGDELSFDNCHLRFRIAHNPPSRTDKTKVPHA